MNTLARAIYGVLGTLTLALGLLALIDPARALPPEALTPLTAHLVREQGAEGVFIGIMALWCLFNLDRRGPVHLALMVFTALFAGIHWAEYFQARREILSPLLNSLPFVLLVAITPRPRWPAHKS